MQMTQKKFDNLQACARPSGIIAALAIDQRESLKKALEADGDTVSAAHIAAFKTVVTEVLTPYASAVLLDLEYGLGASRARAANAGLLLAYEESGYDNAQPGRLPDLEPRWSVRRLQEAGATGVKLLLYYNPFEGEAVNEVKHAFIERIGAECETVGLPLFLEPITYDDALSDANEFAARRPRYVCETIREFSKDRYGVDILKVETPVSGNYVSGLSTPPQQALFSRDEAAEHFQRAAELAKRPFIYLSGGVNMTVFTDMLELAGEHGVPYSGVLCGRATWKGGISSYARGGKDELTKYLEQDGVKNITRLNEVVERYARPWYDAYGGLDGLELS